MSVIKKIWEFFIPLLSERNDKGEYKRASLGRISFWIVFGIAIWIWIAGTGDIQASHLQMLYITATYNLMKKASWFNRSDLSAGPDAKNYSDPYNDRSPRI